ncbi:MAG: nicotinate (nicotinamide) nucleotide adenylyltransferase [Candidatus Rokubacteria bacterium]|nr:nicotinate (nicotinamide) nucleotide adenylyltransferase [Candidatus Rokubacteria bacterium]
MRRIGILGGSFNPIHLGHLLVADDLREALALDEVRFVPARHPPHKPGRDLAPAEHRYAMTRLAVQKRAYFSVSDVELNRQGPSYTVDTLEAFRREAGPEATFFLLLGSELFLDLLAWKDPQRLATLARLVVMPRTGSGFDPDAAQAQKVLQELGQERWIRVPPPPAPSVPPRGVFLVSATSLPIAASDLRRRAREQRSLRYRVPDAVAEYIAAHKLYQGEG